jgi:hypothetical protein
MISDQTGGYQRTEQLTVIVEYKNIGPATINLDKALLTRGASDGPGNMPRAFL